MESFWGFMLVCFFTGLNVFNGVTNLTHGHSIVGAFCLGAGAFTALLAIRYGDDFQ